MMTIENTTISDLPTIEWLFSQAMMLQGKNGYKVWANIDYDALKKDIALRLQYKIVSNGEIICIFSVQYSDPFIWQERDQEDAIYLHRIVVNPSHKGQKQFSHVLEWAKQHARERQLRYVRMDTWAENQKIIDYYLSFAFRFLGNYRTGDEPELPIQNRNLNVALLELDLSKATS